jgi:hypothetical protein
MASRAAETVGGGCRTWPGAVEWACGRPVAGQARGGVGANRQAALLQLSQRLLDGALLELVALAGGMVAELLDGLQWPAGTQRRQHQHQHQHPAPGARGRHR